MSDFTYGVLIDNVDHYWDGTEWSRDLVLCMNWNNYKRPEAPPGATSQVMMVKKKFPPRPTGRGGFRMTDKTNQNFIGKLKSRLSATKKQLKNIPKTIKKLEEKIVELQEKIDLREQFEDKDFLCMRCAKHPGYFFCDGCRCDAHKEDWLCKKCSEEDRCYECM